MDKKLTKEQLAEIAFDFGLELETVLAVRDVESGGKGFADDGKIIIQFEPLWWQRKTPKEFAHYQDIKKAIDTQDKSKEPLDLVFYNKYKTILENKVSTQGTEWVAFNLAFSINPDAAMESTSIGLMQVMGFHYKLLGFATVGAMWDFAKESEANQMRLGLMFVKSNTKMYNALRRKDWANFAYYYNGSGYKKFKYDTRLQAAYNKY